MVRKIPSMSNPLPRSLISILRSGTLLVSVASEVELLEVVVLLASARSGDDAGVENVSMRESSVELLLPIPEGDPPRIDTYPMT